MGARVLDGKALALEVRRDAAGAAAELRARGVVPGLAVVLAGDDPASHIYVRNKTRACEEAGLAVFDHRLAAEVSEEALLGLLAELAADRRVHGILVQLPLPPAIDERRVLEALPPGKDVDGFHPENVGYLTLGRPRFVPCTPAGVMRLIEAADVAPEGRSAVVVGRSNIVGKPVAALLTAANATVTVCHSRTPDLAARVSSADIVVAAVGRPELVRGAWIREGAVVIDVGINRQKDGKLVGDVEYAAASERARAITPVPGGVGPMTIAMLVRNTVRAAAATAPRP